MNHLYDCSDDITRRQGMTAAERAIRDGQLVVLPTDTVYGVGADAFSPTAVAAMLAAKDRGRGMPSPVLVGSPATLAGVAVTDPTIDALVDAFWPGGLTLICREQPSLQWDLGDTDGTVAARMPDHEIALELLTITGPLAVSSANVSGQPAAKSAEEALEQLGDRVAVYLEAGPTGQDVASTIIDVTGPVPRVVRAGALSLERLREVASHVEGSDPDRDS